MNKTTTMYRVLDEDENCGCCLGIFENPIDAFKCFLGKMKDGYVWWESSKNISAWNRETRMTLQIEEFQSSPIKKIPEVHYIEITEDDIQKHYDFFKVISRECL